MARKKRDNPALVRRFGRRLKQLRLEADLTQMELAERIETSYEFVGLMERGENAPSFVTLELLSEALERPVKEFFEFE